MRASHRVEAPLPSTESPSLSTSSWHHLYSAKISWLWASIWLPLCLESFLFLSGLSKASGFLAQDPFISSPKVLSGSSTPFWDFRNLCTFERKQPIAKGILALLPKKLTTSFPEPSHHLLPRIMQPLPQKSPQHHRLWVPSPGLSMIPEPVLFLASLLLRSEPGATTALQVSTMTSGHHTQ